MQDRVCVPAPQLVLQADQVDHAPLIGASVVVVVVVVAVVVVMVVVVHAVFDIDPFDALNISAFFTLGSDQALTQAAPQSVWLNDCAR